MIATATLTASVVGRPLLAGVDLRVAPGELVALVGPNGVGKSTLLRLLAGDRPAGVHVASGAATIGGRPVAGLAPAEAAQQRAVVRQHADVAFPLTVQACVGLGALVHGLNRRDEDALVDAALQTHGLSTMATRRWPTLSGGERQRVALARAEVQLAAMRRPPGRALLADEPTAHMDLRAALDALAHLRRLAADGVAVLVVLHDLALAARCADRLVLLGPPERCAWPGRAAGSTSNALSGRPRDVLQADALERAFGVPCAVHWHGSGGVEVPAIIPSTAPWPPG
jgi:iron complex transport system ATP-binding protein